MTINLITQQDYEMLQSIQKDCPKLTFQNEGFEYIDKSKLDVPHLKGLERVNEIMKRSVMAFVEFNNFKIKKTGEIMLRFQYVWTADDPSAVTPFTGVCYLTLEELLKGF